MSAPQWNYEETGHNGFFPWSDYCYDMSDTQPPDFFLLQTQTQRQMCYKHLKQLVYSMYERFNVLYLFFSAVLIFWKIVFFSVLICTTHTWHRYALVPWKKAKFIKKFNILSKISFYSKPCYYLCNESKPWYQDIKILKAILSQTYT